MSQNQGAAHLRTWLKEQGRTQKWLAERLGTHQTTVSSWLLGRPVPLDKAIEIRDITGIAVEEWVPAKPNSGALPSEDDSLHHRAS